MAAAFACLSVANAASERGEAEFGAALDEAMSALGAPTMVGVGRAARVRSGPAEVAMASQAKVKGPASYFPSIEKAYGKPVAHWFAVLDGLQDRKHMEQVAILESEHGIGHGHANALVAYHRARGAG